MAGITNAGTQKRRFQQSLATGFTSSNGVAINGATAREAKAAVTSKRHWITGIIVGAIATGEFPTITVEDDTAVTPVTLVVVQCCDPHLGGHPNQWDFDKNPIEVASGKAINVHGGTAAAAIVTVLGYVED